MNPNNLDKYDISDDQIQEFLEGGGTLPYVVKVEASYYTNVAQIARHLPDGSKRVEKVTYNPFAWVKRDLLQLLGGGEDKLSSIRLKGILQQYGITITQLETKNKDGKTPLRLETGYQFLLKSDYSFYKIVDMFKTEIGYDIFSDPMRYAQYVKPDEQFMIQHKVRLFKGFDDYDDVDRLQFDLETTGLDPETCEIFQIGIKTNKGYTEILEVTGDTPSARRASEKSQILKFFSILRELKPAIITGYNSASFDWPFIVKRCDRLHMNFRKLFKPIYDDLKTDKSIGKYIKGVSQYNGNLKLGQDTERFTQTDIYGAQCIDIAHAVRRAMVINTDIKSWGLKYITAYNSIEKSNRVYIPGAEIHDIWAEVNPVYYFNDTNGEWFHQSKLPKLGDKVDLNDYTLVSGTYLIRRYLEDDLWETDQVDKIYNQASFLIGKLLPTNYIRTCTMGTAGQWQLLMLAWSYENGLGIPDREPKLAFTGGLSRLLSVGYFVNVYKFDYAAMYPKIQLTHEIKTDVDITGVMSKFLAFVVDTRDEYKFKMGGEKDAAAEIKKLLKSGDLDEFQIAELEKELHAANKQAGLYDNKQLPLKILANSFFGSFGAPHLFNWGDLVCAEETTCRGRQYLRLMAKEAMPLDMRPLVCDTDGMNFAVPDSVNEYKYQTRGDHWKTKWYGEGKSLIGAEAFIASFNENFMIGRMGLDIDDVIDTNIIFRRKNYVYKIGNKVKFVGNTLKARTMPTYIEEFLSEALNHLLNNEGKKCIELYHKYVTDIIDYKMPAVKLSTIKKIKVTPDGYRDYCKTMTKAGRPKSRMAHMELILRDGINVKVGDRVRYLNIAKTPSSSDIKKVKDKETGKISIAFNCRLITEDEIENETVAEEYNAPKYIMALNEKMGSLLSVFHPEIREAIILKPVRDKKTKEYLLPALPIFTDEECELVCGYPLDPKHQDGIEGLMDMSESEILFWHKLGKAPNNISEELWEETLTKWKADRLVNKELAINGELATIDKYLLHMSSDEFKLMRERNELPNELKTIAKIVGDKVVSTGWEVELMDVADLYQYEADAINRTEYYRLNINKLSGLNKSELFDKWYSEAMKVSDTSEQANIVQHELYLEQINHPVKSNYQ